MNLFKKWWDRARDAIKVIGSDFSRGLFMSREKELIDYVEQEAKIAESFAIAGCDDIQRQGSSLLSILLSGAGGGLALAISLQNQNADSWLYYGSYAVSFYLFAVSGFLTLTCLWSGEIDPPANEPNNLYKPHLSLLRIRRAEIKNRNERILFNKTRNITDARRLNQARIMSACTPIIFILCASAAYCIK
jgi:hypothetical protein